MKIFISRDIILSRECSEKVQPWPLNSQQRFKMRCSNIVQRVIVVSALVFSPLAFCYGQVQSAPGGINGASLWSANGDSSDFIGNYRSINLLKLKSQADTSIPPMQGATTVFLVLKPNFTVATGAQFFELGDIVLYDNQLTHGSSNTMLDFSDQQPKIITLTMQRSPRVKRNQAPSFQLVDSSLFSVAELIYYPLLRDREDVKRVNSYLALKYSVPITAVTDPNWRDYWTQDQGRYWDFNIDKVYDLRVMGVGKSEDEDFYQTQTQSSSSSFIRWSLDSIKGQGVMPKINVGEDAFLVFSERVPASMAIQYPCVRNGSNPLGNWKLKPQQWKSKASHLLVSLEMPSKGGVVDSVFMTDGASYTFIPVVSQAAGTLTYRIPLAPLSDGMHYFFTDTRGNPCSGISIGTAPNQLTVDNSGLAGGLRLKSMDYTTGLIVEEPLANGRSTRPIGSGQHQVWVLDDQGRTVVEQFIKGSGNSGQAAASIPLVLLAPNPIAVGQSATLRIEDLPDHRLVTVNLTDASGRLVSTQTLAYRSGMSLELSGPTPGMYTVTVYQGSRSFSQKLLVVGQ